MQEEKRKKFARVWRLVERGWDLREALDSVLPLKHPQTGARQNVNRRRDFRKFLELTGRMVNGHMTATPSKHEKELTKDQKKEGEKERASASESLTKTASGHESHNEVVTHGI